jgi:hypothetical protein
MELQEFKTAMGVSKLQFHKSKSSDRAIASGAKFKLVTGEGFDPSKPAYVYENNTDLEQSEEDIAAGIQLYWLSNKDGAAANPAFEL